MCNHNFYEKIPEMISPPLGPANTPEVPFGAWCGETLLTTSRYTQTSIDTYILLSAIPLHSNTFTVKLFYRICDGFFYTKDFIPVCDITLYLIIQG